MAMGNVEQQAIGASGRHASLLRASAMATTVYAILLGLLVLVIFLENGSITVPLVILSGVGLVVAAVMATTRQHWTAWLAAAFSLIALAGDGPHAIPQIVNPQSVVDVAAAVAVMAGGLVALAFALRAALSR